LPKEELGIFYTKDCYVFLCRYFYYNDDELSEHEVGGSVEVFFFQFFSIKNIFLRKKTRKMKKKKSILNVLYIFGKEEMQVIWDG
jgi:hypothetical protein